MILGTLQPVETWDAAAALSERRTALELDLLGSVLARPKAGVEACQHVGFDFHALSHEDLRLMYVACEECCDRRKSVILRIIKRLLCISGYWDRDARWFERRHRWSDESLASFACSFPGTAHVVQAAKELTQLDAAMRAANEHFNAGLALLREAV